MLNGFHGRSGGDNEAGGGEGKEDGMECGRRKAWSPAGTRGVEHMKGKLEVRQGYNG
jgi:hypothetical protein